MANESIYNEWIASRRTAEPSQTFTDQVMAAVAARDPQDQRSARLADRINESRSARWAACLTAMLIGSLPFLLVAHVAYLLVF